LTTSSLSPSTDSASYQRTSSDNQIIIRIKDIGIGIDSEIFTKIFSKTGGTGLGLFISKAIMQAHGVILWAENGITPKNGNERRGDMFTFSMSLNKEQEQHSELLPQPDMRQIDHL
jgi:signal transduction histidine kinase